MTTEADFVLPSSPADRKKIKDAIYEISGQMQQIADKRSNITDTKKWLKEEFGLPPKITGKMAKTVFDANYAEVQQESTVFELAFENLFETNNSDVVESDEE